MAINGDKAIIGIGLAAMIIASIFNAMMQTSTIRGAKGEITKGCIVYLGERGLDVSAIIASDGAFYGVKDSTADGEIITVSDARDFDVSTSYPMGPYNLSNREGLTADLYLEAPEIGIDVLVGDDSIVGGSVLQGLTIKVRASPNFGGIMKEAGTGNDVTVEIKFTSPNSVTQTYRVWATRSELDMVYLTDETWEPGTWKVTISSDTDSCNQVDISSPEVEFTVRASEPEIN